MISKDYNQPSNRGVFSLGWFGPVYQVSEEQDNKFEMKICPCLV